MGLIARHNIVGVNSGKSAVNANNVEHTLVHNKSPLPLTDPRVAVPHAPSPTVLYTDAVGHCDKLVTDDRQQFITLTTHLSC